MPGASEIGWYPSDPSFRRRFEQAVVDGLRHFATHGDITRVQCLLVPIPDKATRQVIAKSISSQFPVLIRSNGTLARDKARAEGFDWSALDCARFWPRRINVSEDRFYIKGEAFSAHELIEEVLDALVLQRNAITDDQVRRLKEAVDALAQRRA